MIGACRRLAALFTMLIAAAAAAPAALAETPAAERAVVEAFYAELLSAPNRPDLEAKVRTVVTEDWVSIPQPRGGPGAEGMVKTLRFFGKKIPDLAWSPQEILKVGEGRYVVRSVATGTPKAAFFGVESPKAGFEIMTIDIHQVEDGRIVQSYHVEDWARAIRQVAGTK